MRRCATHKALFMSRRIAVLPPATARGGDSDEIERKADISPETAAWGPIAAALCIAAKIPLSAMYGRRPYCKRNLTSGELVGCSHVSGLFMRRAWPLALM
jgi:hypothetical protein